MSPVHLMIALWILFYLSAALTLGFAKFDDRIRIFGLSKAVSFIYLPVILFQGSCQKSSVPAMNLAPHRSRLVSRIRMAIFFGKDACKSGCLKMKKMKWDLGFDFDYLFSLIRYSFRGSYHNSQVHNS